MLNFSTKAKTLSFLENRVTKSRVLPQLCFLVSDLHASPDAVRAKVVERFDMPLIVRSSALSEDTTMESQAGKCLSIPNVLPEDILFAMEKVKDAFADNNPDNQILIQPMLTEITMSGVLFTIDPNTGGNYFVINYDKSGSADSVTSGAGQGLHTCYLFHKCKSSDAYLDRLADAAFELMGLFDSNTIDIEFAFTKSDELYLLQARPLVMVKPLADYNEQKKSLSRVQMFLEREMCPYDRNLLLP